MEKFKLYETLQTPGTINMALTLAEKPELFPVVDKIEVWVTPFKLEGEDKNLYKLFNKKGVLIEQIVKTGY
jgi:hypothetical protein